MAEAPAGVEQRGIVRLSTLAVLRLIAPCGALDPEFGRSAGFSPLRTHAPRLSIRPKIKASRL